MDSESRRTTHYTDLLWRNLQILARKLHGPHPPSEHDITTSLERHMAPKFSSSEISSCEQIRCHPSLSWHFATNMNPYLAPSALSWLDPHIGRASIAFYLFNVMASSKTTISNADVGICETTQGNDFDLQQTTQHVLFRSQAHYSSMMLPWEQLRRFKTQILTVLECLIFPKP